MQRSHTGIFFEYPFKVCQIVIAYSLGDSRDVSVVLYKKAAGFLDQMCIRDRVNTVNMLHRSSLRVHYMPYVGEDDIYADGHLDASVYGNMGGGFPIFVKNVGVIGVVAVSGLTHTQDHQMAVDGVAAMLGIYDLELSLIHI